MISNELLREVLAIEYAFDIQPVKEWQPNILEWYRPEVYKEQTYSINIYELAHKCKEWIMYNGVNTINSGTCKYREMRIIPEEIHIQSYCDISKGLSTHLWIGSTKGNNGHRFYADSEPEAIFKVCEWILDNKDK